MFTDMVGYTALMQADEGAALEKRERYWGALEGHHDAFGGTVVQRLGDGSMSMFPSSLAAVQAAVGIQRELSAQDVPVRLGIHVGEVIVEDERLTGEAVNIAARIESFATPGGVMLSDSVYDQIKNRSDVSVVALGRFRLKNVGRPFELYAVEGDGLVVPEPAALEARANGSPAFRTACLKRVRPSSAEPSTWSPSSTSPGDTGSSRSQGPAGSGRPPCSSSSGECLRPSFSTAWRLSHWPTSAITLM